MMGIKENSCWVIACDVLQDEVAHFSKDLPHLAGVEYLEMGLHDRPDHLREQLNHRIGQAAEHQGVETVILVYGLCGSALAGVGSDRLRVVLPRAHDCITLFLGSKEAYAERRQGHTGEYYYTPGWNRGDRVPSAEKFERLRKRFTEQFDEEEAEYLVEMERAFYKPYHTATHLHLGVGDPEGSADHARKCAAGLGWNFQSLKGDPTLLCDLLSGEWDAERFCLLQPGQKLQISAGPDIIRPCPGR